VRAPTSTVYVSLSSTDVGSAVASTHYTTDGSTPTLSSPTYTRRIPITSTTTVTYRSWDHAGNAEAANSLVVATDLASDSTAPTTVIACDGQPCTSGGYNGSTKVSLTADDGGGWGVDSTYYTTDGSTPTLSSTVYDAPFTLSTSGSYTVKWFSTDLAGNAEQVQSQQIGVDPPKVTVSLTFDDGLLTQYTLADKRALKPHHMAGTFYDVSGANDVDEQHMTWAQLTDLNNDGHEIGGHTVDHVSLKGMTDMTQLTYQVCQDRQNLIAHGFDPTSFAYPTGAYDAQAESVVQSCGYTSGRAAGGLDVAGEGAGPVYAETTPPHDTFALRTLYDPPSGNPANVPPLTLSHLEAAVTAAAEHGGGWVPLVFHDICSQQLDPDNYSFCINDWGPIELTTLNDFLDWLQNSGQPGGAPARTVVQTVSQVMNGADNAAPATTMTCNGSACAPTSYAGSVTVSFKATDPGGSGVAATYYTTDGSTPTTSSPKAGHAFTINGDTTFKFFSVDNAGNVEPVSTLTVLTSQRTDPVVGAAGDIACDPTAPAFNSGVGTDTDCRAAHTAPLLEGVDAVLPLGDVQYDCGGTAAFAQSYDPSWGVLKPITHPVPGDKDVATSGGTDCPSVAGAGYYQYFGAAAGDPAKGYYSYNLGQWHVVALNTAPCPDNTAFCAAGSSQEQWLKQDLATDTAPCTLAYYQNPRFASSGSGSGDTVYQPFWQDLYDGGVDVVLNGDEHWYERFTPLNAAGQPDSAHGVRQFIVGTGGAGLDAPGNQLAISEKLNSSTHGVLRMTLHGGSYDWAFVPDEGAFTDSGSTSCHSKPAPPDNTAPTTTIACGGSPCSGFYAGSTQVSLAAVDNSGGSGVDQTYYTTDGSAPTTSSTPYTGPFTLASASTVRFFSVDKAGNSESAKSQQVQVDGAPPTTSISCNGGACSTGWYSGTVSVALAATDSSGSGVAATYYTTDGSTPTASSAQYTGAFGVTQTRTVKYFSVDTAGNAEAVKSQQVQIDGAAPTTSISCNGGACSTGWYAGTASLTLAATDPGGSGVAATYYTTDGSAPTTSSTRYTGAIGITQTRTVKYFSVDTAGNAEAVKSQTVQVDATAPTTTIACNSATCSTGWYAGSVSVTLAAGDSSGSGVAATYYTTNGSTPTRSSTQYTGAFSITQTRTVKYFSVDTAGNAEAVKSQTVQIDTTAPATTITCNNGTCSTGWYGASATVRLAATDASGGSGVAATYYTTDGSTPTTSSTRYTGSFTLAQTRTVTYFSIDRAGNSESVKSQLIRVDATAPTTTISCNGGTCASTTYPAPVSVSLTASDGSTGSGVSSTHYTTNGTTPTLSSPTYTGPFMVSATATVKFRSWDVAGNREAVNSRKISVAVVRLAFISFPGASLPS
jgi:peptidoglycan/xylan/chitin deacetylase (PgdA/CDA1 family)